MLQVSQSTNFVLKSGFYTLEAFVYDEAGPLVVTFEHFKKEASARNPYRVGWIVDYLRERKVSHVAVKPHQGDWYRRRGLTESIEYLKESGFLNRFERVITCGGSMGGYGALAFSGLLGADTVVAFNPLTTLNRDIVPWETRFQNITKQLDWTGPFSDAAEECARARQIYAVVDRRYDLDWKHIARLPTHNLHVLNAPYLQHQLPLHLLKLSLLEPLLDNMVDDQVSTMPFSKLMRSRRELQQYFAVLEEAPRVKNSEKFREIVERYKSDSRLI